MEFEKVYLPLVIQKKKNYIGLKYEMDDQRWKIDYKGIAVKRRNYCPLVKDVFWSVIYPALGVEKDSKGKFQKVTWNLSESPDRAIDALRDSLHILETGGVNLDDLVISASLKSTYKGKDCGECLGKKKVGCGCRGRGRDCMVCHGTGVRSCGTCGGLGTIVNLPHVQLAKRMQQRDEGSEPKSGQRFGFVIVNEEGRSDDLHAKSEDPRYAREMGLDPDYIFYLEQQIKKPLMKFLTLVGREKEAEAVFESVQRVLFEKLVKKRREREKEVKRDFFVSGVKRMSIQALKPPKKTKKSNVGSSNAKITSFFVKK